MGTLEYVIIGIVLLIALLVGFGLTIREFRSGHPEENHPDRRKKLDEEVKVDKNDKEL